MSVVTANDIERANGVLTIGLKDVITPLAADRAKELGVTIERVQKPSQPHPATKSHPIAASTAKPAAANPKSTDSSGTACHATESPIATVSMLSSSPNRIMVETPSAPFTTTTLSC
jgi:hypothetical protein